MTHSEALCRANKKSNVAFVVDAAADDDNKNFILPKTQDQKEAMWLAKSIVWFNWFIDWRGWERMCARLLHFTNKRS